MQQISYQGKNFIIKANLRDDTDQSVHNEIFKYKEYRSAEDIIKSAQYPIIDVGAHAGFFSLYAHSLNPTVQIFALEPEPNNIKALKNNLKLNNTTNITVIPYALAENSKKRQLALMEDNHNHYLADENEELEQGIVVEAISFKDLVKKYKIKQVDLLKMDIEGGEYEVVANLDKSDYNKIAHIIMEYHNNNGRNYKEIEQILRENGFGIQIFPSKFDKSMGFLLANNKRK